MWFFRKPPRNRGQPVLHYPQTQQCHLVGGGNQYPFSPGFPIFHANLGWSVVTFAKRCIIIPTTSWQLPEGFWGTCVTQFYTAAYGFQIAKYREKLLQLRDSHTTPSNVVQNLRISFRSLKQITDYTYRHLDVAFFCDCCVQITSLQGFGG